MAAAAAAASKSKSTPGGMSTFLQSSPDTVLGWVIRVALLLLAAIIVPNLPEQTLMTLDYSFVRLIMLIIILVLSFWDPTSAILLAVAFVVGIQTLNKYRVLSLATTVVIGENASQGSSIENYQSCTANCDGLTDSLLSSCCNNPSLNSTLSPACNCYKESFFNMSDNLRLPPSAHHSNSTTASPTASSCMSEDAVGAATNVFTTPMQFNDIQSNTVADNQETEIRTWNNELGPQGLGSPQGFHHSPTDMLATL
jgi:hypothetical protein